MTAGAQQTCPMSQYPRYCFHLSPTVNTWCLLRATEIHALDQHAGFEGENFFFYKNLPIKWVRLVGVVVAIDENSSRRFYTVDDSSGKTIQALVTLPVAPKMENGPATGPQAPPEPDPYADIDIGAVVDVKGGLSTFRDERQMNIEKMVLLKTTEQEVALWEKRARFHRELLDVPWVLRERDIRRCRKEAERSEAEVKRKKRRSKAMTSGGMARQSNAKLSEPAVAKNKNSCDRDSDSDSDRAEHVKRVLRDGAATGKYNALGL